MADVVDARQGSQRESCLHIPLWDTAGNILILHDDFKIELSVVCVIYSSIMFCYLFVNVYFFLSYVFICNLIR